MQPSPSVQRQNRRPLKVSPNFLIAQTAALGWSVCWGVAIEAAMGVASHFEKRKPIMSTTNTNESASKSPSHIVYHVRDREGGKGFFTRIGAAWPHKDGKGFNVQLEVVPLDGRIMLRVASEKKD
jgi:hypothetical protein